MTSMRPALASCFVVDMPNSYSRCTPPATMARLNISSTTASVTATALLGGVGAALYLAAMRRRAIERAGRVPVELDHEYPLVTETDKSNEMLIQQGLSLTFPEDEFLGEETSAALGGALRDLSDDMMTWIVDPIDGTTNFVHGFPMTCVSIGLAKGDEVILGVVYNPFSDELYQSVRNKGAFLNGTRLEVSKAKVMDQAIVVAEYSYLREESSLRQMMDTTGSIAGTARAVRQTGCGAMDLCFLARGSVDAVFGGVAGVWKPWDWAAGISIAQEAGAVILSGDGGDFHVMGETILGAATPELASSLTSQLAAL